MRKPKPREHGNKERPKSTKRPIAIRKARGEDLRMDGNRKDWGPSLQRYTAILCDMLGPSNVTHHLFKAIAQHINPDGKHSAMMLYQYRWKYRNQIDNFGNVKYLDGDREYLLAFLKAYDYRIKARKPMRIRPLKKVKKRALVLTLGLDKVKKP